MLWFNSPIFFFLLNNVTKGTEFTLYCMHGDRCSEHLPKYSSSTTDEETSVLSSQLHVKT